MMNRTIPSWAVVMLAVGFAFVVTGQPLTHDPPMTLQTEPLPGASEPAALEARVRFVGAGGFSESTLREAIQRQLAHIVGRGLKETRANDAAFFLELFYRRQGYPSAGVDYAIVDGGRTLLLTVREGPRAQVTNVDFVGNDPVRSGLLYDYLMGTTRQRFSRFRGVLPYVEADIETGVERLRRYYGANGFLDATVVQEPVVLSHDQTGASVTIRIREGQQYFFGDIAFAGEERLSRAELLAAISTTRGKPYSVLGVEAMRGDLVHFLKTHGYFQAEGVASASPAEALEGFVPITFTLHPGRFHRFDGVTAAGLDRLPDNFLEKRFAGLSGDPYNPVRLDELYRQLMGSGLFSRLTFDQTALPNDLVRVDFMAQESPANEISAHAGYGTYEGAILGASYTNRNFLGRARPLTLAGSFAQRARAGELLYEDPWLFDTSNRLRLSLYSRTQEPDGYTYTESGARVEVARTPARRLDLAGFLQVKDVSTTDTEIEESLLGPPSYQLVTLGLTQVYDSRKNPALPERGFAIRSGISYSSGSPGLDFTRAGLRVSYYQPIGRYLFAVGARYATIISSDGFQSVPIDERFFSGGGTSVRSFAERDLGPKDRHGTPIGGLSRNVVNAEFQFPIVADLKGAVFGDAGGLSPESLTFPGDWRVAVGVGLRYQLPIGPLRLDYGWNPAPRTGESRGAIHLSFGFAF